MILDKKAITLTKAIAYAEHGGKPPVVPPAGKSGELASLFQYTPSTWKGVSQKYLGYADAELTTENEIEATYKRVKEWLDNGFSPAQIASMHNAGEGEPDAYTGKFSNNVPSTGVNDYGVAYSVPNYAKKVQGFAEQLWNETPTITSMPITEVDELSSEERLKQKQDQYWAKRAEIERDEVKENNFVQDLISAPVTVVARIGQLATWAGVKLVGSKELQTAMDEVLEEPLKLPIVGNIAAQKAFGQGGGKQIMGLAFETAAWLVPLTKGLQVVKPMSLKTWSTTFALKGAKVPIAGGVETQAKRLFARGFSFAFGDALQEDASYTIAATQGVISGTLMVGLGFAANRLAGNSYNSYIKKLGKQVKPQVVPKQPSLFGAITKTKGVVKVTDFFKKSGEWAKHLHKINQLAEKTPILPQDLLVTVLAFTDLTDKEWVKTLSKGYIAYKVGKPLLLSPAGKEIIKSATKGALFTLSKIEAPTRYRIAPAFISYVVAESFKVMNQASERQDTLRSLLEIEPLEIEKIEID